MATDIIQKIERQLNAHRDGSGNITLGSGDSLLSVLFEAGNEIRWLRSLVTESDSEAGGADPITDEG